MFKRLTLPVIIALALAAGASSASREEFNPANTWVFIAGVLSWQDRALASFDIRDRKDRELQGVLAARGVPRSNMTMLLDGEGTLEALRSGLAKTAARAARGSLFIFYYAGHGIKLGGTAYLANHDIRSADAGATGLSALSVGEIIARNFRGSAVLLMADCCYSGALAEAAAHLSTKGIRAAVLTSAEASNYSTGNWTFTQTVIDCLQGSRLADRNRDGAITLDEIANEVADAMKYRERQRSGFTTMGLPSTFVISAALPVQGPQAMRGIRAGEYLLAQTDGRDVPCRVVSFRDGKPLCEFYSYAGKNRAAIEIADLKRIRYAKHQSGKEVLVRWGNGTFRARVLRVENDFHLITYVGWPAFWDEWVLDDRISADGSAERTVMVEWKGAWYPATVMKEEAERWFVHYQGYDASWDEWVTKERIKIP